MMGQLARLVLMGGQLLVGVTVGYFAGRLASWLGFGSAETFFAYPGSYLGCSCGAFLVGAVLFAASAALTGHLLGIALLMLLTSGGFGWGLLKGIAHGQGDRLGADLEE